ncbi:sigma-70 family RNA polymerase sigma factor [Streptomyces sp. HC44]|uniref:Sigma-70 family RNA polymerase sigma factor n=1 Tax=Streptomyces scabichelini TaxID=2711217 RepID=A0A6G4VI21_9ACTN|nr:sigma-70 family RNA polymerase sigma factor [Streptomyces scabichelini]NGO13460.1 sigma-70 family RNA polymerase sigma factor [Streptomyces scabichelini]
MREYEFPTPASEQSEQKASQFLAEQFETHRSHLRAVAYRMLGSLSEADDALQEAWLKVGRSGTSGVENLGGWLTTVVGRVCLDMLRTRRARIRHEEPLGVRMPEPVVSSTNGLDPEQEVLLADSVGLALLVVLETLTPAERLAFVLHDLFAVPYEEIAPVVGRTPTAARQLASRARRRVQSGAPAPDTDLARQREVVDAFLAAAREGDFDALVAILAPDAVVRTAGVVVRGAEGVAAGAQAGARLGKAGRPALVNGVAGIVVVDKGRPVRVLAFTVVHDRIAAIDIVSEPELLAGLDLTVLDESAPLEER